MAKIKKNKKKKKSEKTDSNKSYFVVNKDDTNRIFVGKTIFKDNEYLNMRMQYLDKDDDEWKFTAKGVSIPFKNDMALKFMKKARKFFKKEIE